MKRRRVHLLAFTLIEMLAVVLLTTLVLVFAIDFYLDMSRASNAAVEESRNARRAAVLMDRVARDLEAAYHVKKPDAVDPLEHPWLFLAEEGRGEEGAGRLKFVTRSHRPVRDDALESDLAMVVWMLEQGDNDDFELRRWSSAQLPEGLDRDFPSSEDSFVVADGLADFGVRFQGEEGDWRDRWDTSLLTDSSELPLAAEITVALYRNEDSEEVEGPFVRRVLLPLRAIDLEVELEKAGLGTATGDGGDDDEDGGDGDGDDEGDGSSADDDTEGDDGGTGSMAGVTVQEALDRGLLPPGVDDLIDLPPNALVCDFAGMATAYGYTIQGCQ